jgi:hypothetical protein
MKIQTRRAPVFLSFLALLALLAIPRPILADDTIEKFDPLDPLGPNDYWDGPENVEDIHVMNCSGASDGRAVEGIDAPGEWIQTRIHLGEEVTFYDVVRSAGDGDFVRRLEVQYLDDFTMEVVRADTLVTPPGLGIG